MQERECIKYLVGLGVVLYRTLNLFGYVSLKRPHNLRIIDAVRGALVSSDTNKIDELLREELKIVEQRPYLLSHLASARHNVKRNHYWTIVSLVALDWLDARSLMAIEAAADKLCKPLVGELVRSLYHLSAYISNRPSDQCFDTFGELAWLVDRGCMLKNANLTNLGSKVSDQLLFSLTASSPGIESLAIAHGAKISHRGFECVARCHQLKRLTFSNVKHISDDLFFKIAGLFA